MNEEPCMTSQRVVWPRKGVAEVQPFEPPSLNDGQVLVQTRVTLISPGTERAAFLGMPNTGCRFPAYAPGYSNVGQVAQLGRNVDGLSIGQRVASGGGHASHVAVEAIQCQPVPDSVSDDEAVFFNLITVG